MTPNPHHKATSCLACDHPISGMSDAAIVAAMQAHAAYVNATADRATDVHFAEQRLDALVEA